MDDEDADGMKLSALCIKANHAACMSTQNHLNYFLWMVHDDKEKYSGAELYYLSCR